MNSSLRGFFVVFGGMLVLGICTYLFDYGGVEHLKNYFKSPEIKIYSLSNPHSDVYFTGDIIRIGLSDATPENVYWAIDEADAQKGSIQIDHAFEYESDKPNGGEISHRIDAFYREGDNYDTACINFKVTNRLITSEVDQENKIVAFKIHPAISGNYVFNEMFMASFEKGNFQILETIATNNDNTKSIRDDSGAIKETSLTLDSNEFNKFTNSMRIYPTRWTLLRFLDTKKNEELLMAQPVAAFHQSGESKF